MNKKKLTRHSGHGLVTNHTPKKGASMPLKTILANANIMPLPTLGENVIELVYLSEINYQKPTPHFLIVFRYNDGSTSASYIEKANAIDLIKTHSMLANHLPIDKWIAISFFKKDFSAS